MTEIDVSRENVNNHAARSSLEIHDLLFALLSRAEKAEGERDEANTLAESLEERGNFALELLHKAEAELAALRVHYLPGFAAPVHDLPEPGVVGDEWEELAQDCERQAAFARKQYQSCLDGGIDDVTASLHLDIAAKHERMAARLRTPQAPAVGYYEAMVVTIGWFVEHHPAEQLLIQKLQVYLSRLKGE